MPTRKIPRNHRSVTGVAARRKSRDPVQFESTLERDFAILCEADPDVHRMEDQPVRIEYRDETGRRRHYTPDMLVVYRGNLARKPEIVEVKPRNSLQKDRAGYARKFRAARAYARARGWRFRVVKDDQIRTPYLANVQFLRPFRARSSTPRHEGVILRHLAQQGHTDAERLLAAVSPDPWVRAEYVPALWRLVADRSVGCDLAIPITMRSPLWHVGGRERGGIS